MSGFFSQRFTSNKMLESCSKSTNTKTKVLEIRIGYFEISFAKIFVYKISCTLTIFDVRKTQLFRDTPFSFTRNFSRETENLRHPVKETPKPKSYKRWHLRPSIWDQARWLWTFPDCLPRTLNLTSINHFFVNCYDFGYIEQMLFNHQNSTHLPQNFHFCQSKILFFFKITTRRF